MFCISKRLIVEKYMTASTKDGKELWGILAKASDIGLRPSTSILVVEKDGLIVNTKIVKDCQCQTGVQLK